MNRYFLCAASTLSFVLLSACSLLIPPGIPSGMANPSVRSSRIADYPEHFAYRIDDHRYITIQGNDDCDGMIYYHDTRLGIRTAVATTGLTLGDGAFRGYYAINSDYIAIPAIKFSQTSGALLYLYYSRDGGKTFDRFLFGGYDPGLDIVILNGKTLYVARMSQDPKEGVYLAYQYDISHELITEQGQQLVIGDTWIEPPLVPLSVRSSSGITRWVCGPSVDSTPNHEATQK